MPQLLICEGTFLFLKSFISLLSGPGGAAPVLFAASVPLAVMILRCGLGEFFCEKDLVDVLIAVPFSFPPFVEEIPCLRAGPVVRLPRIPFLTDLAPPGRV